MHNPVRHAAEAVAGAGVASGYLWLPMLEEGLRVAVGAAGLCLALLQIYLTVRAIRGGTNHGGDRRG